MYKTKILVVEDEAIVALEIKKALESFGYEVTDTVDNLEDVEKNIISNKPDLILLDINLGKSIDGIDIANEINKTAQIPFIFITAFSDENTITRAIKTNPVSYIIKPFKREELKSNIMLALYKNSSIPKKVIEPNTLDLGFGYYFDKEKERLYFNEMKIKLGAKELVLLKELIKVNGKIIVFEDLETLIWGEKNVSESTLRTLIYRLRAKLDYKIIETIVGQGCRIKAN